MTPCWTQLELKQWPYSCRTLAMESYKHTHNLTSERTYSNTTSSQEIPVCNSGEKTRPLVLLARASVLTPSLALQHFGNNLQLCLSHNQCADRRWAALHCRNASLVSSHLRVARGKVPLSPPTSHLWSGPGSSFVHSSVWVILVKFEKYSPTGHNSVYMVTVGRNFWS